MIEMADTFKDNAETTSMWTDDVIEPLDVCRVLGKVDL